MKVNFQFFTKSDVVFKVLKRQKCVFWTFTYPKIFKQFATKVLEKIFYLNFLFLFNWNFHEKSLNANFPSYRKENGVSSSWKNSVSCGSTRKKCGVNFSQKWVWHDRRGDFDFLKVWTEKPGWYGFDFFKIRIGGKGKVERSAIYYLLMQRTVKFVAVEKRNMRAVFAVSVGDEKKLARVFGAANERRWTRADCARNADFT